jgi:hypothetical protein
LRSYNRQHMLARVLVEWGCQQIITFVSLIFECFCKEAICQFPCPYYHVPFPVVLVAFDVIVVDNVGLQAARSVA